jgi:hypothetical protein
MRQPSDNSTYIDLKAMTRIRIELVDVYCRDTEDVTGADEFYILGGVGSYSKLGATGDDLKIRPVLTVPIEINDKQRKPFGKGGGIIFDDDVPENNTLYIALAGYDEDANKDWSKHGEMVTKVGSAISAGLKAVPYPPAQITGTILPFAIAGVGLAMMLDKDDELGQLKRDLPVSAIPSGSHAQFWTLQKKGGWYSSWDYTVTYRIHKG